MRKNPERMAWIVLWLAFFMFCIITISIPTSIRWYVFNARLPFATTLTSIRGTVLAESIREEQPIPITQGVSDQLETATIITTDNTSQAVLTFFDESSITLYNNTVLIIEKTERPRFDWSPHPDEIYVEMVRGRIRTSVPPTEADRLFQVKTPHSIANLTTGSYAVEVDNEKTRFTVRQGIASVSAAGEMIPLQQDQLTIVYLDQPPAPPSAAEQNLLVNGDFSEGTTGWYISRFVPSESVTSTAQLIQTEGRAAVSFASKGSDNIHVEASIEQEVNKDVQDFQTLRVSADIRLIYQSLPGGGQLGTEFPIMIQIAYRDVDGNDRNWYHGFYYEPPLENFILYNELNNTNESITQNVWYPYESDNLLDIMGAAKPVYVKSIRIYASGWIYEAQVGDIKLLAQD